MHYVHSLPIQCTRPENDNQRPQFLAESLNKIPCGCSSEYGFLQEQIWECGNHRLNEHIEGFPIYLRIRLSPVCSWLPDGNFM